MGGWGCRCERERERERKRRETRLENDPEGAVPTLRDASRQDELASVGFRGSKGRCEREVETDSRFGRTGDLDDLASRETIVPSDGVVDQDSRQLRLSQTATTGERNPDERQLLSKQSRKRVRRVD